MGLQSIVVRGARVHNLKNIHIEIPRNSLTVITGLAGAGKAGDDSEGIAGDFYMDVLEVVDAGTANDDRLQTHWVVATPLERVIQVMPSASRAKAREANTKKGLRTARLKSC